MNNTKSIGSLKPPAIIPSSLTENTSCPSPRQYSGRSRFSYLVSCRHATSYWETELSLFEFSCEWVPSLPAYTVSAWAKPEVENPCGPSPSPSSPHPTEGCPGPFGLGTAYAAVALVKSYHWDYTQNQIPV